MTVAPVILRRRGLTVAECARRWGISEERARTFLEDFEVHGYARRRGRYWYPTQRARDLHLLWTEPLPELLDAKRLQTELGVSRAAAEAIMRRLPVVQFEGLRKTYVHRADVARLIEERTFDKDQVLA